MTKNPISTLTYGMYIVSTKKGAKSNACVINTCFQVSTDPDRIAISLMNSNYTRKLIKESGVFCVAVLDETCPFGLIHHFGYKSGKDIDKFSDVPAFSDINEVPCIISNACATISAKVVECINLGSHTVFIGKIKDSKLLNDKKPLTYATYQAKVKPKPIETEPEREIIGWRCQICGYIYDSPELPEDFACPVCGHTKEDFEPIYQDSSS